MVGGMGALPREELRLVEGLTNEGGGRRDGRPALMCGPEERLAKGLTKEGGGRRDGRPALRRMNNKEDV